MKNIGSLALYIRVIIASLSSSGNTPCSKHRFAILVSGYVIDSDTHLMCLGMIPSLPDAPSLSWPMISFISVWFVGSKKRDALIPCNIKSQWDTLSVHIFEASLGPIFAKWLLKPFAIIFGSVSFLSFIMNWSEILLLLFSFTTCLMIVQTFRRIFLFSIIWRW